MADQTARSLNANPIFSNCCQGEKLSADNISLQQDLPLLSQELLTGNTLLDKTFRKNIFKYINPLCVLPYKLTG